MRGRIFQYFLQAEGIKTGGKIRIGKLNQNDAELIYRHVSQYNLTDIVARLLEYSNNFIANQILLAAGAKAFGSSGLHEKRRQGGKKVSGRTI